MRNSLRSLRTKRSTSEVKCGEGRARVPELMKEGLSCPAATSPCAFPRAASDKVMLLLATAVGGAYGQGAPARDLQTVVVTAQKREQAAQSVPVSLSAIGGKDLEAAGIDSAARLDQVAVGLTVGSVGPGYLTITMRGISDLDGGLLGTPATGFYIDETPLSAFAFQLLQLAYWDAQRVEVLRGPQGTLFGEGSSATSFPI
ncbi:TonB-dependent receptor plug domain-containing protein [Aquabacterium sp.]|uniref:TonB-dependent receptor plug domain-containing protein n=1 Tax=Aquabacterium sp. TaxID=1872578 RepID=UPI002C70CD2C|nr:TonB-dependent receptor plug domain-containing protein [Aquabacterium sp.]HSW04016.1 TonB-dependent receptor plug domain-containing protein [Aquabacterium sp.]